MERKTSFFLHHCLNVVDYNSPKKSDRMSVLPTSNECELPSLFDAMAMDGAAVVDILSTTSTITLDDHADLVFLPCLSKQLKKCAHLDVIGILM